MRYVSFEQHGQASWGILLDKQVVNLPVAGAELDLTLPATMLDFLRQGAESWRRAETVADAARQRRLTRGVVPVSDVRLLAPIPRPPKNVIALGANYADHVKEAAAAGYSPDLPAVPIVFTKAATSVVGPDCPVVVDPRVTTQLDWEIELGVVIGGGGRWIPEEQALEHVFGYTIVNDLSARDQQLGRPYGQWFIGKSVDGYCPMGPVLVSRDEVPDPQALDLMLRVNGVEKQRSNTGYMIFGVAAMIADLSRYMTLEPGDVIATGTPSGVGGARTPPEFLQPGDVIEAEIPTIGILRTPIVGPDA